MQRRYKVNNVENWNKAMIQRTKDSCVRILHKKLYCFFFFRFCRDGSAQLVSYLHGRGLRSVPADVAEGAVGVFLRVVGAWLAERIWRLGDSFSATPGPTDWERAEHANWMKRCGLFLDFVTFWFCDRFLLRFSDTIHWVCRCCGDIWLMIEVRVLCFNWSSQHKYFLMWEWVSYVNGCLNLCYGKLNYK